MPSTSSPASPDPNLPNAGPGEGPGPTTGLRLPLTALSGDSTLAQATDLPLLAPVNAAILVREFQATSIRVAQIEATRRRCVLERSPDLASEALRTLEDLAEAGPVDIEGDFVRIGSRATRLGPKKDEQRLAQSERPVLTFQLLGAGQLEVEAPQTSRIGGAKRHVVDAENPHRWQSSEAPVPVQITGHSRTLTQASVPAPTTELQ